MPRRLTSRLLLEADLLPETTSVVAVVTTADSTVAVTVVATVAGTATGTVDPLLPAENTVEGTTTESVTVTTVTALLDGTGTGRPLPDPGTTAGTTDEAPLLLPGRGTCPLPGVAMTASKCKTPRTTWTLAGYVVAIQDRTWISFRPV